MTDIILHHYDLSPFSEKIRLALGHKRLSWRSVEIPIWPPRPDTVPLTAGYRRAPVLQIGADIYCDTLLILAEIERRHRQPTLYPGDQRSLTQALSWWADRSLFTCAASLTTSIIGDDVPQAFIDDRIEFMDYDFSKQASRKALPRNRQRIAAAMTMLADMLGKTNFLLGEHVSAADLSAYHPLWFIKSQGAELTIDSRFWAPLGDWMERIAAIAHGQSSDMSPEDALATARAHEPAPASVAADDPSGLAGGETVRVFADEPNDTITGVLVGADDTEIVVAHESERGGRVHVHFPRYGYQAALA